MALIRSLKKNIDIRSVNSLNIEFIPPPIFAMESLRELMDPKICERSPVKLENMVELELKKGCE